MNQNVLYRRVWLTSLIGCIFVSYPNFAWLTCEMSYMDTPCRRVFLWTHLVRFIYFWLLFFLLMKANGTKHMQQGLASRILPNTAFTVVGFGIYQLILYAFHLHHERFISTLIFQFIVMGLMCMFSGYIAYLDTSVKNKEQELNQLRIESLENQCNALTNQINPHFFFNSLNSISSLVRKQDVERTNDYISQLSYVFRYILTSGKKGMVPLSEELEMLSAFSSVMEVRYAGKLSFEIQVPEELYHRQIPVLSLLPLLDNITVHNIIDSDHLMKVRIYVNDREELIIQNPIFTKLQKPDTNGTGLQNLENRYHLMKNATVRIEKTESTFRVMLPL